MSDEGERTSSELIRWLKLLALPTWAKLGLAAIMLLTLAGAMGLLLFGMLDKDRESVAAAVSILTVGLPLGLVVVALVFGDGGARKLREFTTQVLEGEVPKAVRENLNGMAPQGAGPVRLEYQSKGFVTDYALSPVARVATSGAFRFRLELNVRKVNLVVWMQAQASDGDARAMFEATPALHACLLGAEREGYVLNPVAQWDAERRGAKCVFIKTMGEDFLLNPAQRLYFAQDLSFFVRGMWEAVVDHGR
nr:hypothetical protein [Variovorax boronicumulans]